MVDSELDTLNSIVTAFIVNSHKSVTIPLQRAGSFSMLMFGFVQTIGQVHWYVESNSTEDGINVIDAITGNNVSQSVINFALNQTNKTLTITATPSGNCNLVLIKSCV